MWIRIFPDKPVTKKPAETRMGKGKGAPGVLGRGGQAGPRHVRARGDLDGLRAQEAMKLGASKLPIRTRFVERHELGGELSDAAS